MKFERANHPINFAVFHSCIAIHVREHSFLMRDGIFAEHMQHDRTKYLYV